MDVASVVLDWRQGIMFKADHKYITIYYDYEQDSFAITYLKSQRLLREDEAKYVYNNIGNKLGLHIIDVIYKRTTYVGLISKEDYLNFKTLLKLQKLI